ncbi:MAG: hypothetical protein MPJ22_06640 [Pirellulales bacterium]|nr:hypothetical protein [Pirellulales bacterium]
MNQSPPRKNNANKDGARKNTRRLISPAAGRTPESVPRLVRRILLAADLAELRVHNAVVVDAVGGIPVRRAVASRRRLCLRLRLR